MEGHEGEAHAEAKPTLLPTVGAAVSLVKVSTGPIGMWAAAPTALQLHASANLRNAVGAAAHETRGVPTPPPRVTST